MTFQEYITIAKNEIEAFEEYWEKEHNKNPEGWPMNLDIDDWEQQELSFRFG